MNGKKRVEKEWRGLRARERCWQVTSQEVSCLSVIDRDEGRTVGINLPFCTAVLYVECIRVCVYSGKKFASKFNLNFSPFFNPSVRKRGEFPKTGNQISFLQERGDSRIIGTEANSRFKTNRKTQSTCQSLSFSRSVRHHVATPTARFLIRVIWTRPPKTHSHIRN